MGNIIKFFLIYAFFAIGYKTNDSLVYVIPSLICFAIWISWGLRVLWKKKLWQINSGMVVSVLIIMFMCWTIPGRYEQVDPRNGDLAGYAEVALMKAAPSETLFPSTDGETFALWYYQYGLGIRPDVKIVSNGLMQYTWYREQLERIYEKN